MVLCQNCGKGNAPESQFCRFCGTYIVARQAVKEEYRQPRPYAWKTDEFQTHAEARAGQTADQVLTPNQQMMPQQFYTPAAMPYNGPQDYSGQYRCPSCGTNFLPVVERRISPAGWITFTLLLVFTLIFFWIGLLMKEDVAICPICRRRVN
ncbi:MAG: LITAF-like zinc ribbon domain-containing protein [Pyrinomonadaceae bacterium]